MSAGSLSINSDRIRLFAATLAAGIGLVVLFGWASGNLQLTRVLPGFTAMNPMTAAAILLLGLALGGRMVKWRVRTLAAGPVVISMAKLAQLGFGVTVGIDQLLFDDKLALLRDVAPNRMAPNTAVSLALLGLALILGTLSSARPKFFAQTIATAVAGLTFFALIGHLLGNATFYKIGPFNGMALNTAVALLALAIGIICTHSDVGLMKIIRNRGPAGAIARTTLPLALMVPVIVGYLRLLGEAAGFYGTSQGVAIMVFANILVTFALLMTSLVVLFRSDRLRHERESGIARSEERYRLAERLGRFGHWRKELPDGAMTWSRELHSIYGVPEDAIPCSAAVEKLLSPAQTELSRNELQSVLATGQAIESNVHLTRSDGSQRHIKSHLACERDEDGAITALFGVCVDVTDLELARRTAEDATHAKAAFLANMAHEIRTPMNGVMGFAELLLCGPLAPEQKRQAGLILDSGRALLKLLNDILDVSKIDAGQLEIANEPFVLRHGVAQCIDLMRPLASQKGLEMLFEIGPDVPARVIGDGLRLRQILLNLLGNAVKFTRQGSVSVELRTKSTPDGASQIIIRVSDTGVGIPQERIDAVFDEFVQADASISRRFGGSGLGLSISRRLANLMGGSIALANRGGGGTVATLTLPLERADDQVQRRKVNLASPGEAFTRKPSRSASVLLVEDIDINRELVSAILTQLGHKVQFAENGAEALAKAARLTAEPNAWDLILMDVHMPVMDGLTATRAIKGLGGRAATIPIVALSAGAFANEVQECLDSGMNDHLAKPIAIDELAAAVARWTERRALDVPSANEPSADKPNPASAALLQRFERRRQDSATALAQVRAQLPGADVAGLQKLLTEAVEIAHLVAGSAGMFGEPALGQLAHEVESGLCAIRDAGNIEAEQEANEAIGTLISALRSEAA